MDRSISLELNNEFTIEYIKNRNIVKVICNPKPKEKVRYLINYSSFKYLLDLIITFRSKQLSSVDCFIPKLIESKYSSNGNDQVLFTLKRNSKLSTSSIKFKISRRRNDKKEWKKIYQLKFKNSFEFDDFVDNLTLLTKLK